MKAAHPISDGTSDGTSDGIPADTSGPRADEARTACDLETRVTFSDRVLIRDVGGEAVVLHLDQEKFFGLDEIGLRMVSLLREHGRIEPVYRALLDEFEVPADQLRRDLVDFVELLASRDLLRIED